MKSIHTCAALSAAALIAACATPGTDPKGASDERVVAATHCRAVTGSHIRRCDPGPGPARSVTLEGLEDARYVTVRPKAGAPPSTR
jgi:hypothetical protein